MKQQKGPKPKHVPQRTCIICRKVESKRALIRLVRSTDEVEVDPTGKKAGRGAYLCTQAVCWEAALSGNRLEQALRIKISAENKQSLFAFRATLSDDEKEKTQKGV